MNSQFRRWSEMTDEIYLGVITQICRGTMMVKIRVQGMIRQIESRVVIERLIIVSFSLRLSIQSLLLLEEVDRLAVSFCKIRLYRKHI
jgi:hypothetical protein